MPDVVAAIQAAAQGTLPSSVLHFVLWCQNPCVRVFSRICEDKTASTPDVVAAIQAAAQGMLPAFLLHFVFWYHNNMQGCILWHTSMLLCTTGCTGYPSCLLVALCTVVPEACARVCSLAHKHASMYNCSYQHAQHLSNAQGFGVPMMSRSTIRVMECMQEVHAMTVSLLRM